jgi:hypothetical protein
MSGFALQAFNDEEQQKSMKTKKRKFYEQRESEKIILIERNIL